MRHFMKQVVEEVSDGWWMAVALGLPACGAVGAGQNMPAVMARFAMCARQLFRHV
jgi:hypothetical protein